MSEVGFNIDCNECRINALDFHEVIPCLEGYAMEMGGNGSYRRKRIKMLASRIVELQEEQRLIKLFNDLISRLKIVEDDIRTIFRLRRTFSQQELKGKRVVFRRRVKSRKSIKAQLLSVGTSIQNTEEELELLGYEQELLEEELKELEDVRVALKWDCVKLTEELRKQEIFQKHSALGDDLIDYIAQKNDLETMSDLYAMNTAVDFIAPSPYAMKYMKRIVHKAVDLSEYTKRQEASDELKIIRYYVFAIFMTCLNPADISRFTSFSVRKVTELLNNVAVKLQPAIRELRGLQQKPSAAIHKMKKDIQQNKMVADYLPEGIVESILKRSAARYNEIFRVLTETKLPLGGLQAILTYTREINVLSFVVGELTVATGLRGVASNTKIQNINVLTSSLKLLRNHFGTNFNDEIMRRVEAFEIDLYIVDHDIRQNKEGQFREMARVDPSLPKLEMYEYDKFKSAWLGALKYEH